MWSHLQIGWLNTLFSTQLWKISDGLIASDDNEYIDINIIGELFSAVYTDFPIEY